MKENTIDTMDEKEFRFEMDTINEAELAKAVKFNGAKKVGEWVKKALKMGILKQHEVSLRSFWNALTVSASNDREIIGESFLPHINEANSATLVDASAFTTAMQQYFFNALSQSFQKEDFKLQKMFRRIQTTIQEGEYLANLSNLNSVIPPTPFGSDSPELSLEEDKQQTPPLEHRAPIVNISRSAIVGDRTGQLTRTFEKLGDVLATNLELACASTITDLGVAGGVFDNTKYRYNWKGTAASAFQKYATYQSSASSPNNWVNLSTGNDLVDWNNLNSPWVNLENNPDPYTGFPVATNGKYWLLVTPGRATNAYRIEHATMFRTAATTGSSANPSLYTEAPEIFPIKFETVVSKYLQYYNANYTGGTGLFTDWYLIQEDALAIMQMYGIEMVEAVPNSGYLFKRSIATAFKCENNLVPFMYDPRRINRSTAA